MENMNIADRISPTQSDPTLKSYYCPFCNKLLFKGNVKKINMVCHHCQKFVSAAGQDLLKSEE